MSSILDALNKLEDEKEFAREQENLKPENVDAREAAEEMIGRDVLRDTFALRANSVMLIGGGLAFIFVLVVVVAVSVALVLRPESGGVETVASVPPPPAAESVSAVPGPETTLSAPEEVEAEAKAAVAEVEAAPVVEEVVETAVAAEEIVASKEVVEQVVIETPAVEAPAAAPTTPATPVAEEVAAVPVVVVREAVQIPKRPEPKPLPVEINVMTLPLFTEVMQHKYGLDELTINLVKPQSPRNQYGSAVINRKKVYEDAYIAGSQIRLIKVVNDGIAVEVSRTGEKYFIEY